MNWLARSWCRSGAMRSLRKNRPPTPRHLCIVIAILLGAPFGVMPAWPQNEGTQGLNRDNAFRASTFWQNFSRYRTSQAANATPRAIKRAVHRVRVAKAKKPAAAAAAPPPAREPQAPAWPVAEPDGGGADLVPIAVKTVREASPPAALAAALAAPLPMTVSENELSDIDRAAQPETVVPITDPVTDGRSLAEDEGRSLRLAAFPQSGTASLLAAPWLSFAWLEPILLMLAGAIAALTATRIFA